MEEQTLSDGDDFDVQTGHTMLSQMEDIEDVEMEHNSNIDIEVAEINKEFNSLLQPQEVRNCQENGLQENTSTTKPNKVDTGTQNDVTVDEDVSMVTEAPGDGMSLLGDSEQPKQKINDSDTTMTDTNTKMPTTVDIATQNDETNDDDDTSTMDDSILHGKTKVDPTFAVEEAVTDKTTEININT